MWQTPISFEYKFEVLQRLTIYVMEIRASWGDGIQAKRDIVQFVPFSKYKTDPYAWRKKYWLKCQTSWSRNMRPSTTCLNLIILFLFILSTVAILLTTRQSQRWFFAWLGHILFRLIYCNLQFSFGFFFRSAYPESFWCGHIDSHWFTFAFQGALMLLERVVLRAAIKYSHGRPRFESERWPAVSVV